MVYNISMKWWHNLVSLILTILGLIGFLIGYAYFTSRSDKGLEELFAFYIIVYILFVIRWFLYLREADPNQKILKYENNAITLLAHREYKGEQRKEIDEMEAMYMRLKERFKNDQKTVVDIASDWNNYCYMISKMEGIGELMEFENLQTEEEIENYAKRFKEPRIIIGEIERKFKRLLEK